MKKLNDYQEKQILGAVQRGIIPVVGVYMGSKMEHVSWEAREAQGTTPGRQAGAMSFAVHTIISGEQGSIQAHSVRVRVPVEVNHETTNAAEWTNAALKKPLPALPLNSMVICAMSAFWMEKGAFSEEAAEIVELKEAQAK